MEVSGLFPSFSLGRPPARLLSFWNALLVYRDHSSSWSYTTRNVASALLFFSDLLAPNTQQCVFFSFTSSERYEKYIQQDFFLFRSGGGTMMTQVSWWLGRATNNPSHGIEDRWVKLYIIDRTCRKVKRKEPWHLQAAQHLSMFLKREKNRYITSDSSRSHPHQRPTPSEGNCCWPGAAGWARDVVLHIKTTTTKRRGKIGIDPSRRRGLLHILAYT